MVTLMARGTTIDDLPIETSVFWATAQEYINYPEQIKEAAALLPFTEITVATPVYDHLATLFEQHKRAPTWALFTPPKDCSFRSHRLFRHHIIQDLDPQEQMDKYYSLVDSFYEEQRAFCPISAEKMLSLFETLEMLNKLLTDVRTKILRHRKS